MSPKHNDVIISSKSGDETLLDAAHRQGIDWPYQCKKGFCGSCKAFLVSGEVEVVRPVRLILPPKAILLCSTKAVDSDTVIVRKR